MVAVHIDNHLYLPFRSFGALAKAFSLSGSTPFPIAFNILMAGYTFSQTTLFFRPTLNALSPIRIGPFSQGNFQIPEVPYSLLPLQVGNKTFLAFGVLSLNFVHYTKYH